MPNKFELITKAYSDGCADVIRSPQNWCEFLSSACYNYRLRFDEQLLIFLQRPDATAVLEFEKWNKRFNRKINRNAKGIAVFADVERTKIKHYFDISDTNENELSRPVPIWKYKDEYENDVIETFENTFGALSNKNDIVDAVMSAADNAVEDNTVDYVAELPNIKNDSFLEELDDDSISTIYRRVIKNSVAFMVLTRLGINANEYFSREDFEDAVNFNTTETLNALGYATSDITEIALNEVSKTVLSLEKSISIIAKSEKAEYTKAENKNIERSVSNDTNHLQKTGRSAGTELGTSGTEEFDIEQIWSVEEKVSKGGASSAVLQPVDNGQTRQPSARSGRESEINGGIIDEENVSSGGLDRGAESNQPNGLGAWNEQPETESAGNRDERGNLRSVTDELPPFLDNDLIMGVLENSDDDLVHKKSFIVEKFKELSVSQRIPYTQTLYGGRFTEYNINNTIVGLKAEKDGLLMYEGTYKSRTKESGFSWGVVAELIGQLIDSGKYLPKEKKKQEQEQSAQIGLFDYVADIPEEQYADESNQVSLFTEFGVSQQIIDEALCIGANDTNSTLDIAMLFRRDRGTEYNTEFLKKHYKTNGAGFYFNNEQVSVWYNENGFNVAKGTTAQKPSATHLTWEQVAKRIRELLDMGRYIPQEKLDIIDDRELSIVSDRIISFVRDMDDEENSEYLPRGKRIVDNVLGYPDEVAALKEYLSDGNNSVALFREYSKFAKAYENGMINLYKYNYEYSVPYVYEIFKGMQIEPTNFKTADDFNPNRQYFISNDEIDNFLRRGKSSAESRFRIYTGFANSNDKSERVKFIKDYYGLSGSCSGNDNLDSSPKGLTISHGNIMEPYAKVVLKWNQVEKHIDDMIKNNRFFYDSDFDELQNIYKRDISYSVESFFNDLPDEYAKPYPKETETYNISYVVRDKLDNPQELDNIEKMMSDAMALMGEDYNGYKYRKQEYDDFVAFKNGTYAPYRVPEKAEQKPPHTFTSKFSKAAEKKTVLPEWLTEYREIKAENPQAIVFYQQGDFYEAFEQDAVKFANELDLVLTSRHINENTGKRIAMCGFPKHSLDKYMKYLADKGYKIAVSSLGNDERKTIWYAPDYSEDENEKEEQNISIEPTFQAPPKSNAYAFDLHPEIPIADRHNYNFAEKEIETVGKKERFRRNMEAIRVLKECEFENRFATPEEQEILSGYVGWGGISEAFDENNDAWADEFQELYTALSPTEYEAARRSTLTAFYTPQPVISAIYKALDKLGFKQGNILEPCCAIGNFIGMLPQNMQDSKIYGVEIDNISADIAQQLYQKSSIMTAPFEKAELPDSFFDAVVGNVPFGDFSLADKKYDKYHFLIHDYFFAKSLDKLRPGGVMALVTSKGTMDKENSAVRKYIAQRAELLGAIRLPNNTFKGNAGTEVVSDILILQKRDRLIDIEPDWVHLDTDENGIKMNSYFVQHPEMILGEMKMVSGRFGMEATCVPYENADLAAQLDEAVANIHGEITEYETEEELEEEDNSIPADPTVRNFSYTLVDDKIYYRENSRMTPVEVSATAENRIKGMIAIRNSVRTLIELQTEDYPDSEIKAEQERLNRLYDTFSGKYGLINSRANTSAFSQDSSFSLLSALEIIGEDGELERKADMFSKRTIKPHTPVTSVDTASEALAVSLGEKATIDMDYMMELSGKSENEIFEDLKGVIFLNPLYEYGNSYEPKYLMADEYLSGNVREKLRIAKNSAELYPEDYKVNVEALQKVQPKDLTASEISVRLGATWLPPDDVQEFIFHLLETPRYAQWNIKVHFSPFTSEWNIEGKSYDKGNVRAYNTYGTSRINAYKIIEETLNLKDVRIFDYIEDDEGKKKAVLNKKETAIAQSKQEMIKQEFQDWIWSDPERRERLCKSYNEKFNSVRPREYDGSHIIFNGMNPEIELREHQKNAVAHILYGGNTLLAHAVGAGKTFEMVAAAQESKRLGLCNKSLFVVPNHLTEQWAAEYLQLYPAANILVATKKDFETKNRKKFCGRIATGDYDAVIIGHSQFEKIPMSIERQRAILEQQLEEITGGIAELKRNRGENFSIKQLEKSKKSIRQKLDKLNDQTKKDDVVTFEELGVDRLFVDESHYYKNLYLYTKMRNVGGIAQTEAQKSSDLFMKCRYLDEITGGRGTVFATGTPISNSMVELYTIQRYLQYNTLVKNGLQHFDAWASTFGETITAVELTPEGYTLIGR